MEIIQRFFPKETDKEEFKYLFLQLFIPILLFAAARWLYFTYSRLSEAAYFSESISLELIKDYKLLLVFAIINLPLLMYYRELSWKQEKLDRSIKFFLLVISFVIGWSGATYDFNLYFNQGHNIDRIIILIFPFLILLHPLFVSPFIVISIALTSQFEYPLHLLSWTDKKLLYYCLILFNVYLYSKLYFKKDYRNYLILVLILIGCNYFYAAIAKIILNWLFHDQLQNLFVASYLNGWLAFIDKRYIIEAAAFIGKFNFIFLLSTLIIELSSIVMLKSRNICISALILFSLLHTGIFLLSGILFWKWITMDLTVACVVYSLTRDQREYIFSGKVFVLTIFFIIISIPFFKPVRLGWYDTRLNEIYTFEAVGESGKIYDLHSNFFSPYDLPFSQNRFYFLSDENLLVRTYGSTENYEIFRKTKGIENKEELEELEKEKGRNYYDGKKTKILRDFLHIYFSNLNSRGSKVSMLSKLAPPKHILTFPAGDKYDPDDKIRIVNVVLKKIIYRDNKLIDLSDKKVLSVPVEEQRR